MLRRYLLWQGFDCRIFNVGDYRRKVFYFKIIRK